MRWSVSKSVLCALNKTAKMRETPVTVCDFIITIDIRYTNLAGHTTLKKVKDVYARPENKFC